MACLNFIAAFQHGHNASLSCLIGDLLQLFCHPFVVKLCYSSVSRAVNWISLMGIKPSWNENEIRLKFQQPREHFFCKFLSPLLSRSSCGENRNIKYTTWVNWCIVYACVFITWASAREKNSWVTINKVIKMDWGEKNIFSVVKIKPRLELMGCDFDSWKRRHVSFSDKRFRLD